MLSESEWSPLREVMMHYPGVELEYAMTAPGPFLFERPFNIPKARREHENLQEILRKNGVKVRILKDEFLWRCEQNPEFRRKLEEIVLDTVKFYGPLEIAREQKKKFVTNLPDLDSETLLHFLTLEPSVDLRKDGEMEYPTIYSNLPLANLYFMRDQQAVSKNSVIMGRMRKLQRMKEVSITAIFFKEFYGDKIMHHITRGFFEGGDFMPAKDFALIGTGPRSDIDGVSQILDFGLDFDEIVVVNNPLYDFMGNEQKRSMVNMHLDTYFNLADRDLAITSEELCSRAGIDIYYRDGDVFTKAGSSDLLSFLRDKGFEIINLRISEQMSYSSNFLTISPSKIVAVKSSSVLEKLMSGSYFPENLREVIINDLKRNGNVLFPENRDVKDRALDVQEIDLSEITGGYGGAHCMTATLKRG
ncbi:MAG: arginine deiminase family protein [Candidatus Thermoplasmatota archaeon]|nr:arginine deiminase family protein [Candidatus Thermoplasmatota archaeon]